MGYQTFCDDIPINDTSYELRVLMLTSCVYCMSYVLSFAYELRVTGCCTSYKLPFGHELQVTVYCMSYDLLFAYEL